MAHVEEDGVDVELDRLRAIADSLGCLLETDLMMLAQATAKTVEAWRKRGTGPDYILIGNRYLYPKKQLAAYLEGLTRSRSRPPGQSTL